jgi:hypothetical protein
VRQLELARLDRWLLQLNGPIMAGSLEAMDRGLKIMTRRAQLLGLDAPAKVAPTTPDGTAAYEGEGLAALLALAQQGGTHAHATRPAE